MINNRFFKWLEPANRKAAVPEKAPEPEADKPRSLTEDLDKVREAIGDGREISPEDLQEMTGLSPEEYFRYATGEENIQEPELQDFHESLKASLIKETEAYRPNLIKRILQTQAGKAAFVSLLLFLKFAPQAEAAKKGPEFNKEKASTEAASKTINLEGGGKGPSNTYYMEDAAESAPAISELASFDLTNSYVTDKADIHEQETAAIKAQFNSFLDQINSHNFNSLINRDWEISGSSDERRTNAWPEGNYGLTLARIAEAEKILSEELKSHDWSDSDLSPAQVKALQSKVFSAHVVSSETGPEKGVTYITDLTNPDTGEKYTAAEAKKLQKSDPDKYQSLLDQCRFTKVNLLAESEKAEPIHDRPDLNSSVENNLKAFDDYSQVILLMDDSPSMKPIKDLIADKLAARAEHEANIIVSSFSNKLDRTASTKNFQEAGEKLKGIPNTGSSSEKAIACADAALDLIDAKQVGEKLVVLNTDESLQDVTMNKLLALQEKAKQKNAKVEFSLNYDHGQKIASIPLDKLIQSFRANEYGAQKAWLEKYSQNKRVKASSRHGYQKDLENLDDRRFSLREFIDDDGNKFQLNTFS